MQVDCILDSIQHYSLQHDMEFDALFGRCEHLTNSHSRNWHKDIAWANKKIMEKR